ncbi:type II secretion system minor pseudopilin GspK [Geomonas propionica]|uniref:Type II secretion system minor pseudopilin GspK n=1 Tax=Geomonas propionica TaxID=2798582 RepID=A0ABS0YNF2_9BACT|nr:type II secretion system minor pseudopilin GspK [Geomonas propionica]MBJ6799511.1 type II secretion system minor pseudopilin GspK [Geomonas propionica]
MRSEKGFALVIALIVTTLLVALLAEFVNEVYVDTSHSHNFVASQQAGILAESGIAGGLKILQVSNMKRQGQKYTSLLEPWATPQTMETDGGLLTISIEEENGKLNINDATTQNGKPNERTDIMVRLLTRLKLGSDLADSLLDWVDENEFPNPGGAESSYYHNLKPPYAAKNSKLETVEELALVKGFTPEALAKLRPYVTVYSNEQVAKVNVNTASKDVLLVLDDMMTEDRAQRIIDYRKERAIIEGDLPSIAGMERLQAFFQRVCYMGSIYRIRSEGRVGESIAVTEAVVDTSQSITSPKILYWREY